MYLRDKYGWPVERFKNRPVINFIRLALHTSWAKTWELRFRKVAEPWDLDRGPVAGADTPRTETNQ